MQDLSAKLPGVERTRVGYTGGDVKFATYRNHGTHAEGIDILFDPARKPAIVHFWSSFSRSYYRQRKTVRGMTAEAAIGPPSTM